jgi:hypothetical protein
LAYEPWIFATGPETYSNECKQKTEQKSKNIVWDGEVEIARCIQRASFIFPLLSKYIKGKHGKVASVLN